MGASCLVAVLCGVLATPGLNGTWLQSGVVSKESEFRLADPRPERESKTPGTQSSAEPDVDFSQFHRTLGWNFVHGLVSTDNLWAFAVGAGGSLAATSIDDEVTDKFRGRFDKLGQIGHLIGNPVTVAALVGSLVVAAPLTDNRTFRAFSYSLAQAQILDSALKYGLKAAVSRTRPNGENDNSFPSGHTSATFAFATVAGHYYGKKVSIPAYGIAAFVGASRIENGKHFLSDVLFGATLGYIAGRTAVRGTERTTERGNLSIHPMIGLGRTGLRAHITF